MERRRERERRRNGMEKREECKENRERDVR